MTRRLAREEGLFVGQSCGMAMAGALQWLEDHTNELSKDDVVVIVLPDSGFRYLSKTYNDNWMQNNGFLERNIPLTLQQVMALRKREEAMVTVGPADTLGEAISQMTEYGISQIPVMEGKKVVGSLTETSILNRLIEDPEARNEQVAQMMGEPFPVVRSSLHIEDLSSYLDKATGAVLVQRAEDESYEIITKSDLIRALASAGKTTNHELNGHKNG